MTWPNSTRVDGYGCVERVGAVNCSPAWRSSTTPVAEGVIDTHHRLSMKHLNAYLDGLEWRYDSRGNPHLFRDILQQQLKSANLRYQSLVRS